MPESPRPRLCYLSDPPLPPLQEVAQAIADGETWLFAWTMQSTVSYRHLSRDCRIKQERLLEIDAGEPMTLDELAALAKVWRVHPDDIRRTLPPGALMVE